MDITKRKSPKPAPMDAGLLTPLIAKFAPSLRALGQNRLTNSSFADSAPRFATWVLVAGLQVDEIGKNKVNRFARRHCQCPGALRSKGVSAKYARRVDRFVALLAERGVIQAATASTSATKRTSQYAGAASPLRESCRCPRRRQCQT
jgi:hypothetical protein